MKKGMEAPQHAHRAILAWFNSREFNVPFSGTNADTCERSDRGQSCKELQDYKTTTNVSPSANRPQRDPPTVRLSGCDMNHTDPLMNMDIRQSADLQQSFLCRLDYKRQDPLDYHEVFSKDGPHFYQFTSPRAEPEITCENRGKLQRNTEAFQNKEKQRNVQNLSKTTYKPRHKRTCSQDDFQMVLPSTHDGLKHPTSHTFCKVYERETPTRKPFQEIFPKQVNRTRLNIMQRPTGGSQTSDDVLCRIWNHDSDHKNSSKMSSNYLTTSSEEPRLCYREVTQHSIFSEDKFQSYHGLPLQGLETNSSPVLGSFLFEESKFVSETESFVQKPRVPRLDPQIMLHQNIHPSIPIWRWRNICEPPEDNLWSVKSTPTKDSLQASHTSSVWDRNWQSSENWSLFPSSESMEEVNSFNSPPRERSLINTGRYPLPPTITTINTGPYNIPPTITTVNIGRYPVPPPKTTINTGRYPIPPTITTINTGCYPIPPTITTINTGRYPTPPTITTINTGRYPIPPTITTINTGRYPTPPTITTINTGRYPTPPTITTINTGRYPIPPTITTINTGRYPIPPTITTINTGRYPTPPTITTINTGRYPIPPTITTINTGCYHVQFPVTITQP
ncbi:Hypothetical predicted protein [Pelobates cultripes]|uniref:Uncharacterized protein n=1 Tax=Pelobates cultripes TaxID=61616 RepID=A0AAD1T960_PELCU|nr:Hypothetical predicted protein [Pelobates cultripes]